jgi:hypothetical protein
VRQLELSTDTADGVISRSSLENRALSWKLQPFRKTLRWAMSHSDPCQIARAHLGNYPERRSPPEAGIEIRELRQ